MQARDVIMGLAGVEIEKQQRKKQGKKQGYSRNCIIYYAIIDIIDQVMPGKDYYTNTWAHRLDCIYRHDQSSGDFARIPSTTIHAELQDQEKDIGGDSAKVLMCRDFRYFGKDAVEVPDSRDFDLLRPIFQSGRGDPVLRNEGEIGRQLERLHQHLWSKQTKYTPTTLDANGPRRCRRDEGTDGDEEGAGKEAEGNGLAAQRSHKC